MRESELLSFAITCLKQSGLVFWRVPNGAVRHTLNKREFYKPSPIKGFPDLAGVFPNGKFFAIEIKTDKGKLSEDQKNWITKLNMTGAIALVLRSKDEIREFVAAAMQKKA